MPFSRFRRLGRVTLFTVLAAFAWPQLHGADDSAAGRWALYEPAFKAFAEADVKAPPAPGGILFVGSSIFRQWASVTEQLAPLPVLNRAVGGTRTGDQFARFDQLVPRYRPKILVYYCGSNDLKAGDSPEDPAAIFARFRAFAEKAHAFDPALRLVFVASFRSPDRVARWEQVDHYNALARAYCAADPRRTFLDLNPLIVDAAGHPRLELYKDDKLHYHPAAYERFAAKVRPALEALWADVAAKP